MSISTRAYRTSVETPEEENIRCAAEGCPLSASIGGRCFFHANVAFASTRVVTDYITRPYVETKGEGDDGKITMAEALIRNGILHYSEIFFAKYAWKGKTYYPQAIAEREYRQLWQAGLIPDELKGRMKTREDFLDALNRRPGHIIRFNDNSLFCTDWIVDTYRSMLLETVKKAVARSGNVVEYVPTSEDTEQRIAALKELSAYVRRGA